MKIAAHTGIQNISMKNTSPGQEREGGIARVRVRGRDRESERLTKNQIRQIKRIDVVTLLLGVSVPVSRVDDASECRDRRFEREDQEVQSDERMV